MLSKTLSEKTEIAARARGLTRLLEDMREIIIEKSGYEADGSFLISVQKPMLQENFKAKINICTELEGRYGTSYLTATDYTGEGATREEAYDDMLGKLRGARR